MLFYFSFRADNLEYCVQHKVFTSSNFNPCELLSPLCFGGPHNPNVLTGPASQLLNHFLSSVNPLRCAIAETAVCIWRDQGISSSYTALSLLTLLFNISKALAAVREMYCKFSSTTTETSSTTFICLAILLPSKYQIMIPYLQKLTSVGVTACLI